METELRSVVFVTILHRKLFPLILQDPYIVLHANKSTLANEFRGGEEWRTVNGVMQKQVKLIFCKRCT